MWIRGVAVTQRSLHKRSLVYHNLGKKYVDPRAWSSFTVHTLLQFPSYIAAAEDTAGFCKNHCITVKVLHVHYRSLQYIVSFWPGTDMSDAY